MSDQPRILLTDTLIERMLAERAGRGAPGDLVDAIATAVESTPQRPLGTLGVLSATAASRLGWAPGAPASRRVLQVAVVAVAALVVVIGAGLLLRASPSQVAGPSAAPSVAPVPSPSIEPSSSPAPSGSSTAVQPNAGLVVFGGKPDATGRSTLWIANPDGTGAHELAPGLGGCQGQAAWSRDGTRLLFSRGDCGFMEGLGDASTRLYLTDASGSAPRLVDTGCVRPCVSDSTGAFSSDGRRILFVRMNVIGLNPDPVRVLASIDLATGLVTEMGTFEGLNPRWSPDGTQIVFERDIHPNPTPSADRFTSYVAVFVADADGRNLHRISPSGDFGDWSPDGARIVFQGERYGWVGNVERWFSDIYTVRPDGTDLRRLTTDQISTNPSWSVDGRIWFIRTPMVNGNLQTAGPAQRWIMDADGGNASQPSLPPLLQQPYWEVPVAQPTP